MKKTLQFIILFVFVGLCSFAQTKVKGKVTDATNGNPIAYAGVSVKGTSVGGVTNAEGVYTLTLPANAKALVVSFIGYTPVEVSIGGRAIINLQMQPMSVQVEEVVVTGFQSLKKETFTGSSVKLKAEDLMSQGVSDVSRMLEGKVAGVSLQNVSSTFGTAPKIRIRGVTSINGENKPLWVVDGIVLEDVVDVSNDQLASGDPTTLLGSSVAGINPNDIETFDILKDAAATALYGARAMNGVVVITTKRGQDGKAVISYNGNFTMRLKPNYDEYNIMNSADQMSVYAELERKGYLQSDVVNHSRSGIYGNMYNMINTYNPETGKFLLPNTVDARHAYLMKFAGENTDWFDLLFGNTLLQEHSLSISSGSAKSRTYASLGFLRDGGWTVADKVNRYTMNFRNDYTASKKIRLGFQATGSFRQQVTPGSLSREKKMVEGAYSRDFDINPFSYALNTSRALRPYGDDGSLEYYTMNYAPFNILNELQNNQIKLNVLDMKVQGEVGYTIIPGLRFDFVGAVRYVHSDREHEIREQSNMAEAYRAAKTSTIRRANKFLYTDPDHPNDEPIVVLPYGGFYNTTADQMLNYDIRNSLTLNKTICGRHELNALLGQQIKSTDRQRNTTTGYGYQYGLGGTPYPDYHILKQMIESQFNYYDMGSYYDRFAAFYLNADYTFDRRYSFSATVRYDGSNSLGSTTTSRWLPTWNVSGKWIIGNEKFMRNAEWVDALSLRASYGLTASMPPVSNATAVFYNKPMYRPGGGSEPSIVIGDLANTDLTWEKSYQFNTGIDAELFDHRISVAVDYFRRNSFDLITLIKSSGMGGFTYKYANYADLDASGVDVSLGVKPIVTKDWKWSVNFIFGYSHNEIKNMKNKPLAFDLVRAEGGNLEGYPVNGIFSVPFTGLNPTNGVPTFVDENGKSNTYGYDMQSTSIEHLKYEGSVDPKYTGGLNTSLVWKNFSLNMFFSFQAGNKIRLYPSFATSYSDLNAMPREFARRWSVPGDELTTNVPSIMDSRLVAEMSGKYPYGSYNYSSERIARGDFIRLKTLSLNYRLPSQWLKRTKVFSSATLMLTGQNLWLIYADKKLNGQDPEFFNSGGVAQPLQKQFVLTLNLGF